MAGNPTLPYASERAIDVDLLDTPATPLVFNASIDTTNMANVVLIDSTLADKQVFYDSANAKTFPIIYDYNSKTDDLLALLREKFPASSIQRISLVFHDRGTNFMAAFMNNKPLFQESDLASGQTSFTENVAFLISCLKEFHVGHIDFLACNTLQYSNWKSYYALLAAQTSVIVGASNDKTGNLNYGGDWVMENTHENVRDLYFNASISNYASTLVLLTITLNGANGDVGLRMNAGVIQYFNTTTSTWISIGSGNWPVQFVNSNLSSVLRVVFTQDLTISNTYGNTLGYFIAGSSYITFDGSNNFININNITSYVGLIQNGSTATLTNGYANVIVQNIKTNVTGGSLNVAVSGSRAGWICAGSFGRGALANQIINCSNNGATSSGGGICGDRAGTLGGSVTFTNCTNSGTISGANGGGITSLTPGGYSGSATFVNCMNSGEFSGQTGSGGISGASAGINSGSATFTGCMNTIDISGNYAGGIAGQTTAGSGSATFTNCTNTGQIRGAQSGGIVGVGVGQNTGSATFTNCTNSGNISGVDAGGIAGYYAGNTNGSVTFTNCTNSGNISNQSAGGIVGSYAGQTNGSVTITNCFSTGLISGQYSGGIVGDKFASNTSRNCVISQCYSIGDISGNNTGGIVGSNVGYSNNAIYTGSVNITNCYSLGNIATTCGGICGGYDPSSVYFTIPTITITNCYSSGTIVDANSGLVAVSLTSPTSQINLTTPNTYVAAGAWSDASANAPLVLTGTPTNINTNNPGATWTTLGSNTPYVLSVYNAALYSPNSASSFNNYTSAQGLFESGYTYQLVYTSQAGNQATARVFAAKGTAPYYNSYNFNTFALTNLNGGSGSPISATINASNGVLDFILPYPCFLEGTKILCFENNQEVYRPVESLQKGDLVKTIYNGYVPVCMMGTTTLYNPGNDYRVANRLYKCSREKYPTLFEDLYITGCHSILVPSMTDDQWENTKAVNGNIYVTDNHFRLIACADEKAEPFNKEGFMNIYHIALEHPDIFMNYGIYANGLLVESCSIDYLIKYSNLKIMGQDTRVTCQEMPNNMIRQLVDTC
jgi:hypothetical protein